MICDAWGEDLSAWMDGELTAQRAREVAHHVQGCEGCQRGLRAFRQLTALAKEQEAPYASPRLTDPAMALVRTRGRRSSAARWSWQDLRDSFWPKLTLGMASAALAGFLAFVIGGSGIVPNPFATRPAAEPQQAKLAAPATTKSGVAGELAVADSAAGVNRIANLAQSLGGSVSSANTAPGVSTVFVTVPPAKQAAFIDGLSRLGTWQGAGSARLPDNSVPIGIRVVQHP